MEENHTFQFTPVVNRNQSLIPTIASLPNTPSKVPDPDRSPTVRKNATPPTPMEPLGRSSRITKGVPLKQLKINWCNETNQLLYIYQCEIGS